MVTSQEFLEEFCKEIVRVDPMDRQKITNGYAAYMKSREDSIRAEVWHKVDEVIGKFGSDPKRTMDILIEYVHENTVRMA